MLTASARAYEQVKLDELRYVEDEMPVARAFALDTARHLAIGRWYPGWLAIPDRWKSWQPFAKHVGSRLIRRHAPAVIWSTYPIASAHAVAATLHQRTGIAWIADMRDPMVEIDPYTGEEYPRDPAVRAARLQIESSVAANASHVVFCTEAAREIFVRRFGEELRTKTSIIPNGYDEEAFRDAERSLPVAVDRKSSEFVLVHSGTVYPGDDRGPDALLRAMTSMRDRGALPRGFKLILRATGYDEEMRKSIAASRAQDLVLLEPAVPYREAIQEMLSADGLLLLQGSASNPAVPAKLYEYMRASRPILALVHPEGETAALLSRTRAAITAPLDDFEAISRALERFIDACKAGRAPAADPLAVASLSRAAGAAALADLLSRTAGVTE